MIKGELIGIIIIVIGIILLGWIFINEIILNKDTNNNDNRNNSEQGIKQLSEIKSEGKGLGNLCSSEENCKEFCLNNQFACEVHCIKNPENSFCKQRFSYLSTDNHTLMRFPEFRNFNYTFKDGKLQEKNPVIQNLGVNIDYYDAKTNKAGDFVFTKFKYPWGEVFNNKVFFDYGYSESDSKNITEHSPQLVYNVPLGTKVLAIGSGVVTAISNLYSGDLTIFIINPETPSWIYEHEHIINPKVKEGDYIVAGQVIAEVSNYSEWLRKMGYGVVDIGLFKPTREYPGHHCPFRYFNESLKKETFVKIKALYKSWEEYEKNSTIYDENNHDLPGCVVDDPL